MTFRPLNLDLSGDGDLRMTEYNLSIDDWGGCDNGVPLSVAAVHASSLEA